MGYSCSAKASLTLDAAMRILQAVFPGESSNTWKKDGETYFFERGREQYDGAITGTVYRFVAAPAKKQVVTVQPMAQGGQVDTGYCRPAGSIKIDPEGKIVRFATMSATQRQQAETQGKKEYDERLLRIGSNV